jgi:hypothetical protein
MLCRSLLVLSILCLAVPTSEAAKVKVWQQYTQGSFDKAKFSNAVVTSEGVLRLSREVKAFANLDVSNVWDLVEDKAGNLYAATSGEEGRVYKITPAGKTSILYASKESHVFSLAVTPNGTVYAGTGPTGKLLRFTPEGKTETVANSLDSYIWALAYEPATQNLFAGTGPKGKIYRIGADGAVNVFYASKQEHILCLALGDKGTLYAGTDKGGLVYRLDSAGKPFVLYHANQPEVRSLLVAGDVVYAGTSAPVARRGGFGALGAPSKLDDAKASPPAPGENSIYSIAADGSVRELYRDKTMILHLAQRDGKVLAATGMQGQLFEINVATKEKTEVARLDAGLIHCLLQRRDGSLVLGTGDPGRLFILEDRFAAKGTVISEVLDAKMQSKWGAMAWKSSTPEGTAVSVAVRSGNVADPDDTWTAWSVEQSASDSHAKAPLGRYLQYRVTLTSDSPKATPAFRQFSLRYQTLNQAPEISSFEVPDIATKDFDPDKKLKLRWSASDPNDDELTYDLYFRKEGWKEWVPLEENFDKTSYDWDTTGIPSGIYQLKLVASDRKDNAAESALRAERISAPVPVTHVPPAVTVKLVGWDGDKAILEASAADPYVRLTEASFAIDGKRWVNVFPSDGLFDSKSESFRFKTADLRPGAHVLVLRVRNAAGNTGSGDILIKK